VQHDTVQATELLKTLLETQKMHEQRRLDLALQFHEGTIGTVQPPR